MDTKIYQLGATSILLRPGPVTLVEDGAIETFQRDTLRTDDPIMIQGIEADLSFLRQWEPSVYTGGYELRHNAGRSFLLNHWMTKRFAYGVYFDELHSDLPLKIYCSPEAVPELRISPLRLMASVGLHHRMLRRRSGVLHASYVGYKGRAILFAAPSQVGKSTQAELWRRYAGAEVINGDRALLYPVGDKWYAGGYFTSGSSGICRNVRLPLAAIILLEQGPDNALWHATEKEGIRSLLSGLESFHWDVEDLDLALSLAGELARELPIVHFRCTPEEEAVTVLRNELEIRGILC